MINSLLELIGALFLAGLPIFLMLARIRRRRGPQQEAAAAEGPRRDEAGVEEGAEPRRSRARETGGGLQWQDSSEYRPLSSTGSSPGSSPGSSEALLRRVDRYPPLQRAFVLKELLGSPKGLDAHLPGGNT